MTEELSLELRELGDVLQKAWQNRSNDEQRSFAQSLGVEPGVFGGDVQPEAASASDVQSGAPRPQDSIASAVVTCERIAAVSGAVAPAALVPSGISAQAASRILDELAPSFDRTLIDDTWSWTLKSDRRLSVLRSLSAADVQQALSFAREVRTDAVGMELRHVLAGGPPHESTAPLAVRALAHEWAAAAQPALAGEAEALRRESARRSVLASFDYLLDKRFFGRAAEMQALREFVQRPAASAEIPLLPLSGIGGSGKSTLLARVLRPILAEALDGSTGPMIVSIDFDRRCLLAGAELEMSFEASRQLGLLLPHLAAGLSRCRERASVGRAKRGELSRSEPGAAPESLTRSGDEFLEETGALFRSAGAPGRAVLLVLDTFEEWQREQYVRDAPAAGLNRVLDWASRLRDAWQLDMKVVLSGRSPPPKNAKFAVCAQPIVLNELKRTEAVDMLRDQGVPSVSAARELARIAGGMPLALKLASRYYLGIDPKDRPAFIRDTSVAVQGIFGALRQGVLYGRFLDHIGDEDAQKVAHPGLALRRVSIQLIREVLAEPCELDASRADKLFTLLAKEVWLVEERGPYLVHRPELRKVMLKAMQHDKEHAARLRRVHEAAARWYEALPDPTDEDRAEALYHRVALASAEELDGVLAQADSSLLANVAQSADDFDDAVRVQLLARLDRPLSAHDVALLPAHRRIHWANREASELVRTGQPERALALWAKVGRDAIAGDWYPTATFQAQRWDDGSGLRTVDFGAGSLRYPYLMSLVLEKREPQLALELRHALDEKLLERLRALPSQPSAVDPEDPYFAAVLGGRALIEPWQKDIESWTEDRRNATRYLRLTALLSKDTFAARRTPAPKSLLSGAFRPTRAFLDQVVKQLHSSGLRPLALQSYRDQLAAALKTGLKSAQVLGTWSEKFAQAVHDDLRPLLSLSGGFSGEDERLLKGLSSDDPEWRTPLRIALALHGDTPSFRSQAVELLQSTMGEWIPIDLAGTTLLSDCVRQPRSAWRRAIEYVDRCDLLPQFVAELAHLGSQRLEPVLAAYLRWHELRRAVDTRRGDERASQPGDTPPEDAAAWFDVGTHESGEPSRRVIVALEDTPSDEILRIGHWYTLAVAVDVAQGVAAVASPSVADIDEVAVTVQLDSGDFRIESPIGTLHVPRTGRSRRKARFEISPLHDGPSTLTATLHKDGNYLQNVVVTFVVGGDRAVPMETTTLGRSSSAASVLKPRDIGISLSLTADGYDCIVWGEVAARARLPLQPAYLASAIDALRRELLKVVRYRDADGRSVFQERIDIPASDRDFALRTMARAGALLFQRMFFGPAAGPDAKSVGNYLREAASDPARHLRLQVVAETAPIPWGLLYVGDASAGAKLDWNLFIGMRHIVDEIPLQTTLAVADSTIASEPRLAVSVSVNTGMDAQLGLTVVADQQAYWANAARKRARVGVTSRLTRADVLAALANSATDDQILYFYCQAESGGLSHLGGPDASALVLSDAKLTLGDLVLHAPTSTPLAGKPLVFINACESTELSPAFYDGFVPYFMAKGARGLIGTQVSTPALFAAAWAERFFDRFLAGEAVGDAFLALRREFLEQHGNPLGLLYAVHCDGDIRIEPALQ